MNNSILLAKNTIIMYIRMFVMMIIGLYTSRVILNTLGIEDYGIYNVVGGVVAMFSIISSSLSSSVSRFLTFEIGRGDFERLKQVFLSVFVSLLTIYFWGISKTEREFIFLIFKKYARKKTNSLVDSVKNPTGRLGEWLKPAVC